MKKITLLLLATVLTFVISSCSKTEEAVPVTVVGKWTISGLGSITDTKTYDATIDEIRKISTVTTKTADGLAAISFEFKEDKTYLSSSYGTGTYKVSEDGKTLTLTKTSATKNDIFDIVLLTTSDLKLGLPKLVKATGEADFKLTFETLAYYVFGLYGMAAKGATEADVKAVKSLQGTFNMKR